MATSPSAAFLRLRAFIAERMRMSPIDQTLMLKELLGRRSPAPAHNVARQILGSAWWAGFTFNGITAYGDGHDSRIGGDELSDTERDELQQLCRQRLDTFREQRGEEVFAHRSRHLTPIRGSVKYPVHQGTLRRTDQNGKVAATSERRISRVSGSMGEGSKPMWR
jgi:hypothetical protein